MTRIALVLAAASSLAVSGCANWPEHGNGGLAELFSTSEATTAEVAEQQLKAETGIAFQLDLVKRHLDVLVLEGAELCFPATVSLARQREARIARELAGGLELDAVNDIVVQRRVLNRLERQLDHAHTQDVCKVALQPGDKRPGDVAARIHELLNADNQFARGSRELNPKYVARLGEAAALLKQHTAFRLRISGHADASDEAARARELSRGRAEQVKRYLQIMGITADRIDVAALGADNPLMAGISAATRLTNRRVSIEVLEPGPVSGQGAKQ